MLEIYTIQLAQHRKATALGIEVIDTTVRSGIPAFAPTWDIVGKVKSGVITEEQYTKQYRELMLKSCMTNLIAWNGLVAKEKIAIGCYCGADKFCHRHLLVKYIEGFCNSKNVPFRFCGEIE